MLVKHGFKACLEASINGAVLRSLGREFQRRRVHQQEARSPVGSGGPGAEGNGWGKGNVQVCGRDEVTEVGGALAI